MLALPWLIKAETARFGAEEGWERVKNQGIRRITAKRDTLALSPLNRNPYIPAASPDERRLEAIDILLLGGFDGIENLSGLYRVEGEYGISRQIRARGEASIRFEPSGIKLFPASGAMWAAGREWGDFTLDFRLNPTNLNDGEVLLLWKGRTAHGEPQRLRARVENRRLIWDFEGFFRHGADRSLTIQLRSTPLVPREWRHHRIRYKSDESSPGRSGASPGLLEYLIDDVPADTVHTTAIGAESSEIFTPKIGSLSKKPLILAPDFNGYIDEVRLSSLFDMNPIPKNFSNTNSISFGTGYTNVIDSEYPESKITALRAHYETPANSQIRFFLYASDNRDETRYVEFPTSDNPGWVEIRLKREGDNPLTSGNWHSWEIDRTISGRYFAVGYVLEPGLNADVSPVLSVLEIEYEPLLSSGGMGP